MASSEAPETLATNGHVNHAEEEAGNSDKRNGEPTGSVEPVNDSEQGVSEIDPGESAQPEEPVVSPVLDDDAAASQPVSQSKNKPAKRTVPTLQTTSVKASGPPTPQVKKVYMRVFVISLHARCFYSPTLTCTLRIADIKLGQVWYRCHLGCPTPNFQER